MIDISNVSLLFRRYKILVKLSKHSSMMNYVHAVQSFDHVIFWNSYGHRIILSPNTLLYVSMMIQLIKYQKFF